MKHIDKIERSGHYGSVDVGMEQA